jgi:hypothetical protein
VPVGVNTANPLASGIDAAHINIAQPEFGPSPASYLTKNGSPIAGVFPYGRGANFLNTDRNFYNTSWPAIPDGGGYTMLAVGIINSIPTGVTWLLDGDLNPPRAFQFRFNSTQLEMIGFNTAGVNQNATKAGALTFGKPFVALGRITGSTTGTGFASVFMDGLKGTDSPVMAGTTIGVGSGSNQTLIGARLFTTSQFDGIIGTVVRWNRALSDAECVAITQNPWQLFADTPRKIFALAGAGGAVTITCNVGNANAAGVTAAFASSMTASVGNANGAGVTAAFASSLAATVGNANGAGVNAAFASSMLATVGNANGAGVTAAFASSLAATIGNANAAGVTAAFASSMAASVGNANAAGVTATITLTAPNTVTCNVGNANAAGVTAAFASSMSASVGNANSAGITAALATSMSATVGNANAAGVNALIVNPVTIATTIGNANAAGVNATITTTFGAIGRPTSPETAGAWVPSTGTSLAAMLNEVTPNSANYISTTSASTCKVRLSGVADPLTNSGQVVSYQCWSPNGNGLTVRLMLGGTEIAHWTHAALPTTPTIYAQSLTGPQCDAITDYAALDLQFES